MANPAIAVTQELIRIMRGESGLPAKVGELSAASEIELKPVTATEIIDGYVAAELVEKAATVKYPSFYIYCERITNKLEEKFRSFSGTAQLSIEVRVSHDHVAPLQAQLHSYVEAITDVLNRSRGAWATGMFYTGGYDVTFQPVKKGGKNFIETARVQLEVHMSLD